jgi:DNA-binding response OmpR family regulator
MLSASGTRIDYVAALAAGAHETMYKPLDHDVLLDRIGRLLDLQWTFAQPVAAAAPTPMEAPPAHELSVLHALAREGNMRRIREHADQLASTDEKYRPLAETLQAMAAGYQSKAILNLVESMLEAGEQPS